MKLLVLLGVFVVIALGKSCNSPDTYGVANTYPPVDGNEAIAKQDPVTVPNGKLYYVTVGDDAQGPLKVPVVHVWGSPYEQGFAHGTLLADQCVKFIDDAWNYIESNVEQAILPYVNRFFAKIIAEAGMDAALDYEYEITKDYTSPDFYEEMHGIANGSGVDYLKLRRIHMLPGLTKGHCSMFGTWGKGVPAPPNDHLIQMRALDWDMDGPWGDNPAIVVYHKDKFNLINHTNSWVNIGFVGWIGGLTGMSDQQMGISEIGVTYPGNVTTGGYPPEGPIPIPGVPFIVLLRDILRKDKTITDAFDRMKAGPRSENLILGVGDGKAGYFSGAQYCPDFLNEMTPENQEPYGDLDPGASDWHPRLPDTVYYGMDWECPTYDSELAMLLQQNEGAVTGPVTIENIMGQLQSGSNHIGIYDLTAQEMWVSFAGPSDSPEDQRDAWLRQFARFDVTELFAEEKP